MNITTIGGYDEVGRNMTAIRTGSNVIICDMGIHLEHCIKYTEEEDIVKVEEEALQKAMVIPDDQCIPSYRDQVKLIIPTHAHLDHVSAIPFLSHKYKSAAVLGTPFTVEVLKRILKDNKMRIPNSLKTLNVNATYKLDSDITIEFLNVTHSTPQSTIVAIHSKEGTVLYANDFKFDRFPTLGAHTNYKRLAELGKEGKVRALILDSLYSRTEGKMPSESIAKQMLKDVLLGTENAENLIVVTTFSSHIARLKAITEFGQQLGRKVLFVGRSLAKYAQASIDTNVYPFDGVEIVQYGSQVKKRLRKIRQDERRKYLLVMTGHQGEPKGALNRLIEGEYDFKLQPGDQVIFSSTVIPSPTTIENRQRIEKKLQPYHVRIFKNIHVSGHAAREDIRDLITLTRPLHIIPSHGPPEFTQGTSALALEMGYSAAQVHTLSNGANLEIR